MRSPILPSFPVGGDRPSRQRGFTLLELLVVLAILGLLIGLVAPRALNLLASSKVKVAQQNIERLGGVLDIYKLDVGSYPTTDQGLNALLERPQGVTGWNGGNGGYLKGKAMLEDPWGRPYQYRSPSSRQGHEYDLCSLGAAGKAGGTEEDAEICNE